MKGKLLLVLLLAMTLASGLIACGNSEPSRPALTASASVDASSGGSDDQAAIDLQYGFSQQDSNIVVGIIATNTSVTSGFKDVAMILTVKDENGNVIASDPEFKIGTMYPGEEFGFGVSLYYAGTATPSTVIVQEKHGKQLNNVESPKLSALSASIGEYGSVMGEYANNGNPIDDVMIGVVGFDESGNIINGGFEDYANVSSGTYPYQVYMFGADVASVKAYAHKYI